jgi:hypothetical protein
MAFRIRSVSNMKIKPLLILFLFLLSFHCSPTSTNFSADGYVIDKGTTLPTEGALVNLSFKGHNSASMTNSQGYFKIGMSIFPDSSGAAVLDIQKTGYNSVSKIIYSFFWQISPDTFYLEKSQ